MSSNKRSGVKQRLAKAGKQTKWAPFWIVQKGLGKGKKVHPSRLTTIKRHWRRNKTKLKP
ncbi:MAG: 50S ribosomal protein L39e [DPANN group archaeon]|nr:50S ribosomal protein L39e [DPANN group archaeon]